MVGAMETQEKTGLSRRNKQKENPAKILENSSAAHPRILFHCHCFPPNPERFPLDPDTGFYPGSVNHLCAFISSNGFEFATALSPFEVPSGRCTSRVDEGTDGLAWLEQQAGGGDQILLFASLDPQQKKSCERLAAARERGFTGVKFHPPICRFSIDPRRDSEFYQLLDDYRMPLLIHTGVFSYGRPWPLSEYHPLKIDMLANRFPGIPIIFAHGGGRAFCREVLGVLQATPNTYLDLTHSLDRKYDWHIPTADMEAFFDRLGPSRIIYGVDYPWYSAADLARDLAYLKKLGLEDKDLDLVLGGTFKKILEKKS